MFIYLGVGGVWFLFVWSDFVLFFINRKYVHYRNNLNKIPKQLGAHTQDHVQMYSNCASLTQKEQVPIYTT